MPIPRNCSRCGKLFTYAYGTVLCDSCKKSDEDDFRKVKDYLYNHPGANLSKIAIDLDISVKRIKNFLREGRLEISGDGANLFLDCEKCGMSIKTGLYCEECEKALKNDLSKTASELSKSLNNTNKWSKEGEMHYLHRNKK